MKRIAYCSDSETDDSSGSEEEEFQLEQPQTYPLYKPQCLSQLPPKMPKSTKTYVIIDVEDLPEGECFL